MKKCTLLLMSLFGITFLFGQDPHTWIQAPAGVDALRVQNNGQTDLRVYSNGAVSLNTNWSNPLANTTYISGNVGIGTLPAEETSATALTIDGNTSLVNGSSDNSIFLSAVGVPILFNGAFMQLTNAADETTVSILSDAFGQGAGVVTLSNSDSNDDSSIRLDANYQNSGDARIITDELEIKGGADLAENFDITAKDTDNIEAGMLVSIDPYNEGKLVIASEAYDKKVAGIISGANGVKPGMMMGQDDTLADGDYPVALTGRVYVWADATYGKIEAGDLLTSSPTPGYAMKAKNKRKAHGAVIGKAMTSLENGQGYVLVLVNLQ